MKPSKLDLEQLTWLAGMLEGEGTFYYHYRQGAHSMLKVSMASRDKDVIDGICFLCGGTVYVYPLLGRPFYHWHRLGLPALRLMIELYPYMFSRRQSQIAKAIYNWWQVPHGNKGKRFCKNGHRYTKANTVRWPSEPNRRRCRICMVKSGRAAAKKYRQSKKV